MANNIQIIGNILNTNVIQRYSTEDINLIANTEVQESFGGTGDYIEFYVYDAGGNLLSTNYNYLNYKLPTSVGLTPVSTPQPNTTGNIQTTDIGVVSTFNNPTGSLYPIVEIDPVTDIQNVGYSSGEFNAKYYFFQNKLSNSTDKALFVKEISADRTEIRLGSTSLTNTEIEDTVNSIIEDINTSVYQIDNILNFGNNEQYVAINIALNKASSGYEVLFKMYEPLPLSVQVKQTLWVVHEKVDPYNFDVNLDKLVLQPAAPTLRGPNFDIPIPEQGTVSTVYATYSNLVDSLQSLQQTSFYQLSNLIASQSADINIDYTDYNNFVFFGSAYQRLSNFYGKAQQIEAYNNLITTYTAQTASVPSLQTEINQYSASIVNIITQFDGYEHYLYFESSSYAWPKVNSTKPYVLQSTGSVSTWYNALIASAQTYDANNYDNLEYAVPSYLKNDPANQPFLDFLNMVGHYFDNIWVYIKAITDINHANNNLEEGISRDLVYERLKSLGVKLYNSQAGEALSSFLVGANSGSSTFDNNFTITGSYLNNIPRKDLVSELYKRIYHNLPLLAKTRGTVTGLGYLTTIFGITGSILNVKEYGGSTKSNLLHEYSTEKVRVVPNVVEGNILSSELSLQSNPTTYNDFRSTDTHYVDISFSPETQIDTYAASAIVSVNPTWSLDDYIGDPRQQYLLYYPDLKVERTKYYQTGVTGYPGFTGSLMDYNGFIRLIQYFDNALFKMLADYVPERTSLSTGITINSPVLERNKTSYARPNNTTTQSVYTGEISASRINAVYSPLYYNLTGSKLPYFNGELTGSKINVYKYFQDGNFNPYLGNWDVYNSQVPPKQNINYGTFKNSDFNVLINNVSSSVPSIVRQKIEYIFGTTGSILLPANLQDSYLSLTTYQKSRYDGIQVTSKTYNSWSYGDNSYGKTAAIDRNSIKIGVFTQMETSSLLPGRINTSLKYLVDSNGGLLELNQQNNNWFEVQNIFKLGNKSTISLFDNKKYGNQKQTDGIKPIYSSGYSYYPIMYFGNGNKDSILSFLPINPSAYLAEATTLANPNVYISGSGAGQDSFPVSGGIGGYVNNVFNSSQQQEDLFFTGSFSTGSYYLVPETGNYNVSAYVELYLAVTSSATMTWQLEIYNKNTSTVLATAPVTTNLGSISYPLYDITFTNVSADIQVVHWYTPTSTGGPVATLPVTYLASSIKPLPFTNFITKTSIPGFSSPYPPTVPFGVSAVQNSPSGNPISLSIPAPGFQNITLTLNTTLPSLTADDHIVPRLKLVSSTTSAYTASIADSKFSISSTSTTVGYTRTVLTNPTANAFTTGSTTGSIILNRGLTSFYGDDHFFAPYPTPPVSASSYPSSSLYSKYGNVNYTFNPQIGDIIIIFFSDGTYGEYNIQNTFIDTQGRLNLITDTPISTLGVSDLQGVTTDFVSFLIIKKVPDETNLELTFNKPSGLTSYGFVIPDDLSTTFLNNIDTITKQVKQKLLSNEQGLTTA